MFATSTGSPWLKVSATTKAFGSDLFNAAATTDSAVIFTQPAASIMVAMWMQLDVAFVASGMTDLDITIGDGGDNDGILVNTMNLTSDAVATTYKGKGALWDATAGTLYKAANTDWTAYATSVGANLSTLTAGQVTFYALYLQW